MTLRQAAEAALDSGLGSHAHWDHTMQHGVGCELCIQQRAAREKLRAALSEPDPLEEAEEIIDKLAKLADALDVLGDGYGSMAVSSWSQAPTVGDCRKARDWLAKREASK